ncbi:MAG: amidohydrolase family protein [Acidimicrobiia bacterium]
MSTPNPGTDAWLDLVVEEVVDPRQRIVDPHHHLWPPGGVLPYDVAALRHDVGDGHRVERTVFMECGAAYRPDGPVELRPVGETEFVAAAARESDGLIAAMVGHADLRRSDLDAVLDTHVAAGEGRFRGIRDALSRAPAGEPLMIRGGAPEGLYADANFRRGVARLGARGLTYDSWHYHTQNREFLELARAVPDTRMVLDHFGTPIGVGSFAGRRDEIFDAWCDDIAAIATCENVVAKIGGLAMPDNGFGWNTREQPASSDEVVAAQARYYRHTIECFGPDRCMFESNFPMDRFSMSYRVFWNAAKKMVADLSPGERDALFAGTATRVYDLPAA